MRKILYILLAILLLVLLYVQKQAIYRAMPIKPSKAQVISKEKEIVPPEKEPFEPIGEHIVYTIKLGKVSLGTAIYDHLPRVDLKGKKVSCMTFETKLVRFNDLEKIYSDSKNFLPLRVERSISTWPFSEKISEEYNQETFSLSIVKNKGKSKDERVIKKNSPIHNAILLPFYVRRQEALAVGWSMPANLPSMSFEIKLISIEEIKVPAGAFKAYHFISKPERFEIWITADERKIPILIRGTSGLGYTFLMKEYSIHPSKK